MTAEEDAVTRNPCSRCRWPTGNTLTPVNGRTAFPDARLDGPSGGISEV